jgi:hypothetical protein
MTSDWTRLRHALGRTVRDGSADDLLALLARPLPYTLRPVLVGSALELQSWVGTDLALAADRLAWLQEIGFSFEAGIPPAALAAAAPAEDLDLVRSLAAARGWTITRDGEDGLRLGVAGELDEPPLAVRAYGGGLVIERPLTLLPLPGPSQAVRWATAHAALSLNGALRAARVSVRDPSALTLSVEARLPPTNLDEDEAALLLDGVRHAARHGAGIFDCLRHPAVAAEYGAAHNLPTAAVGQQPGRSER